MVLSYKFRSLCFAFLLMGCVDGERDNPYDPDGVNYNPNLAGIYDSSSSYYVYSSSSSSVAVSNSSGISSSGGGGNPTCLSTSGDVFTDLRDCKTYKTVVIGTQTWLDRNLNYDPGSSGTSVCYGNQSKNCVEYGRLYNWETAMAVCPDGWHLPSQAEWNILGDDAKKLKSTSCWYNNGNGTDDYGFSALPGGYGYSDGSFYRAGDNGYWWSASEYENRNASAYGRYIYYTSDNAGWTHGGKSSLQSVRCLQD